MGLKVKQNKTKLKWKEDLVVGREGADGGGGNCEPNAVYRCATYMYEVISEF